jgi:hypothetical protein
MKNWNVTFYNMSGESLGQIQVAAKTASKAKILAASLYACSWASQTAEAA